MKIMVRKFTAEVEKQIAFGKNIHEFTYSDFMTVLKIIEAEDLRFLKRLPDYIRLQFKKVNAEHEEKLNAIKNNRSRQKIVRECDKLKIPDVEVTRTDEELDHFWSLVFKKTIVT